MVKHIIFLFNLSQFLLLKVKEAKDVCQNRSMRKHTVFVYTKRKAWFYEYFNYVILIASTIDYFYVLDKLYTYIKIFSKTTFQNLNICWLLPSIFNVHVPLIYNPVLQVLDVVFTEFTRHMVNSLVWSMNNIKQMYGIHYVVHFEIP